MSRQTAEDRKPEGSPIFGKLTAAESGQPARSTFSRRPLTSAGREGELFGRRDPDLRLPRRYRGIPYTQRAWLTVGWLLDGSHTGAHHHAGIIQHHLDADVSGAQGRSTAT